MEMHWNVTDLSLTNSQLLQHFRMQFLQHVRSHLDSIYFIKQMTLFKSKSKSKSKNKLCTCK